VVGRHARFRLLATRGTIDSKGGEAPMARILLVDDDRDLLGLLQQSLRRQGHEAFAARDGAQALALARRHLPDLIVLDINMPGMDGLEVCRELRDDPILSDARILFLTERSALEDRIQGLDQGADDYLPKPFGHGELSARVRALLRRGRLASAAGDQPGEQEALVLGDLRLDLHTREARVAGEVTQLTPVEFDLLHYLMVHADEIFSAEQLLQQVWGYPTGTGETSLVRWHVRNLRAKIEPDPDKPSYVQTVPRHGYVVRSNG
jgi:two-component system response regulator MprA